MSATGSVSAAAMDPPPGAIRCSHWVRPGPGRGRRRAFRKGPEPPGSYETMSVYFTSQRYVLYSPTKKGWSVAMTTSYSSLCS